MEQEKYEKMKLEYNSAINKNNYFFSLSDNDKFELFNSMTLNQQKQFINGLSLFDLKSFVLSTSKDNRKNIYKQMTENQIKGLYGIMDEVDKQDLVSSINELQIYFEERKNNLMDDLNVSRENIINNNEAIIRSKQTIVDDKLKIKEQKQELKDVKVTLRKLDKERKKRLRRQLRAAKPSRLDRIAIVSKYRTKRLLQRMEELKETEQNISQMKHNEFIIQTDIENLKNEIKQERSNIKEMREDINKESNRINSITTKIHNTDVKIKKISHTEKRMLGRKLYNQQVSEINKVMVRKKLKEKKSEVMEETNEKSLDNIVTEEIVNNEAVKEEIKNQDNIVNNNNNNLNQNTQESVQAMLNFFNMMQQLGVNFTPNTNELAPIQSPQLINNPVASMNNMQAMLAFYSMGCIANYLYQNHQQQLQGQQQLTEGTGRTLGFVNLSLLISIILFVFSIILFLLK